MRPGRTTTEELGVRVAKALRAGDTPEVIAARAPELHYIVDTPSGPIHVTTWAHRWPGPGWADSSLADRPARLFRVTVPDPRIAKTRMEVYP